jgi:hypothetical protein
MEMPLKRRKKAVVSKCITIFIVLFIPLACLGQVSHTDSIPPVNKKRLRNLTIISGSAYTIGLIGLNQLWYQNSEKQSFHFFNDNAEWKQVDKVGHFYSAFYLSYGTSSALRWCNVPQKKADLIGAVTGFAVLLPIEIMDGFSDAYGASGGDLFANAAGATFFLGQRSLWNQIRIYPKYSFNRSGYAKHRPNVLGNDLPSEVLKDYNGQTYWLSFDMDKFIRFPKWLNLAVGYGAEGMVYARDRQNMAYGFSAPYRQVYLGFDLDLTAFKSHSRLMNTLIMIANMIKLPAPAVEFSRGSAKFHPFMF